MPYWSTTNRMNDFYCKKKLNVLSNLQKFDKIVNMDTEIGNSFTFLS